LISEGNVVVYINDSAIGSKTLNEHFTTVGRVVRILAEYRLEIKVSKCQFESIEFLGYTLSQESVQIMSTHQLLNIFRYQKIAIECKNA